MPFHGATDWKGKLTLRPSLLVHFIQQIRAKFNHSNNKVTLLGFSMGGRIALHVSRLLASQIDRLILIAPDGLHFNFWRWLAADTWLGNKLLGYTIHKPYWVQWLLRNLQRSGVLHKSLADFVHYYLDDEQQRLLLYYRWTSMRKFIPRKRKLKRLVKKYNIQVRMLYGTFDQIIPYSGGQAFTAGIETIATCTVIEAGHNMLHEGQSETIARLFT